VHELLKSESVNQLEDGISQACLITLHLIPSGKLSRKMNQKHSDISGLSATRQRVVALSMEVQIGIQNYKDVTKFASRKVNVSITMTG